MLSIDQYTTCLSCKGKVSSVNATLGQCTKCTAVMKLTKCQESITARLLIQGEPGAQHTVTAFHQEVLAIIKSSETSDIQSQLSSASDMKLTINAKNVDIDVQHM